MKNYVVTGAAGFIGSRVSEDLINAGHSVVGIDNLNDAYDVRMKEYRLGNLLKYNNFTFLKYDISEKEIINKLADYPSFDAVINLAARAGVRNSLQDPHVYLYTNTIGTLNLLEFCRYNNVKKFLLASTSSAYGNCNIYPTPETFPCTKPLQPYAASKIGAEVLAHSYNYLFGIDTTVVRFFTVYGPAGRPEMSILRFIHWIMEDMPIVLYGDGTQSRGFTYVDDISKGVIAALKPVGYDIINLGGHEVITMGELIKKLELLIGKKANVDYRDFVKADMMENHADVSKARNMLGWKPEFNLDEGLKRTIQWYMDNRYWAKKIKYL